MQGFASDGWRRFGGKDGRLTSDYHGFKLDSLSVSFFVMMSIVLIPVVVVVVLALVGLVAYLIKTTKGARGAMDEGRRQEEELKREIEAQESSDETAE